MTKHILLVEDQPLIRKALRNSLQDAGYKVTEAADGDEGLTAARCEVFDLAIADLWMPRLDGIGFLKGVRVIHPGLPVIAMSGGGADSSLEAKMNLAQAHGAVALLFKPFEDEDLLAAVEQALP